MTFFDWLTSPGGQELQHAIIVLLLAVAAYLTYLAHVRNKAAAARRVRRRKPKSGETPHKNGVTPPTDS